MLSEWTKHLEKDPKAKQDFQERVKLSKDVLARIKEIAQEWENSLDRSEIELKQFENPNWPYLQAYKNGCRNIINKIKTLTTVERK